MHNTKPKLDYSKNSSTVHLKKRTVFYTLAAFKSLYIQYT